MFSDPGTIDQALISGTYEKWYETVNNPRYILQQKKRGTGVKPITDAGGFFDPSGPFGPGGIEHHGGHGREPGLDKDWSVSMGTGTVQPNTFPAKWSFSPYTASCANDFVVYPTGSAGTAVNTAATIIAYSNIYTGGCTGTVPSAYWAYNTGANNVVSLSPVLSQDGTQVAFIQDSSSTGVAGLVLLKWHANTTARSVTGALSASSPNVTITSGTFTQADVGAQISGTGIPAGDTISALLTATTVSLATAPTAHASETLTISAEAMATPGVPTTVTNANYRSCTAPCMTTLTLSNSDTFSAPFYDYSHDQLYVGDDEGEIHQFTGVFLGSPAETQSIWPVTLNSHSQLASPVYDSASGYVFVGSIASQLYAVGTGSGTPTTTSGSVHGTSSSLGTGSIIDAPLVDSAAGAVYVFESRNSGGNNAVYQFNTTFTAGTGNGTATGTAVGAGGIVDYIYAGSFDNVYYQSSVHTGNLWVVGATAANAGGTLYSIPITAHVMSATATVKYAGVNAVGLIWASPITEFCNNGASACTSNGTNTTAGTDYLFFSMANSAACPLDAAGNGCVVAANVSTPATPTQSGGTGKGMNIVDTTGNGCWATGGIIVDNAVASTTLAGASQIYFINLNGNNPGGPTGGAPTSTGCATGAGKTIQAVQTSQAAP